MVLSFITMTIIKTHFGVYKIKLLNVCFINDILIHLTIYVITVVQIDSF